ncbi:MAG: peptide-methionine (S)-S-oxide reductase MsrA [Deltaproteobacteria bacterium]|nr:peptide-methionine (S)-S-oxide reductase MsrA [Deltaproteobacteria bacterium]
MKALNEQLLRPADACPGRDAPVIVSGRHAVLDASLVPPFPAGSELVIVGMGCFWGTERCFWQLPGVISTSVGYAGGVTPNPTYEEVCSGRTGHAEVVRIVFAPERLSYDELLRVFWQGHDPTQGMRQGNDRGTQYRSVIFTSSAAQQERAVASRERYGAKLLAAGHAEITTRIQPAPTYYYAEDYHQQYLHKNPQGYCGLGGTGVVCPSGLG